MSQSNILIIGIITGLIIGVTLGYLYLQPELQSIKETESDLKTEVAGLRIQVNEIFDTLVLSENHLMKAQADNRNLRAVAANLTLEIERLENLSPNP